jgi:lysozyme
LKLSQQGLDLIMQSEGFRALPYLDVCGKPTIGYGHLLQPGESYPVSMTMVTAQVLLEGDVVRFEADVNRDVSVLMNQGEFDALVDFCYNLGDRLLGSTLLRLLNAGDYAGADAQLVKWDFAGGKPNAAIKARRVREMALWGEGAAG